MEELGDLAMSAGGPAHGRRPYLLVPERLGDAVSPAQPAVLSESLLDAEFTLAYDIQGSDVCRPQDMGAKAKRPRASQSHGLRSKVYGPILLNIFRARWRQGAATVLFTLDDVRNAAEALGLETRNPADLIYRMRSRTVLQQEIRDKGFFILRAIGRGQYQFEKGASTIFEPPTSVPTQALDLTPLPVRRLLPAGLADMDEQAILTVASYCRLFDHFTGLKVYRLRTHVRKTVPGVGQAELDAIDVGVALREDEMPVVFPIEAKAVADALNRVQIFNMIQYSRHYLPRLEIRPLAIKVDRDSVLHFMEFNIASRAAELKIIRSGSYALQLSREQEDLIRATKVALQ